MELTRSNYTVVEVAEASWYKIVIFGIGSEVNDDFCTISWEFHIARWVILPHLMDDHSLKENIPLAIWDRSGLFWDDKSNTNQIMKRIIVESVQEFLVEVPKAQRDALKKVLESEYTSSEAKAYWSKFKID